MKQCEHKRHYESGKETWVNRGRHKRSYGAQPEKLIKTKAGEEWIVEGELPEGAQVKEGSSWLAKLKPATPERVIKGTIQRNAIGGPVIYNDKGELDESMHVDYLGDEALELSFKGKPYASKVQKIK